MAPPRNNPRADRRRRRPSLRPGREELETRVVLTGPGTSSSLTTASIPAGVITPLASVTPDSGSETPSGYSPQQIRAAYGFDQIMFGPVVGDGAGQTIAIVDAYDDPDLVDSSAANFSTSDLAEFDRQYGLPDPPSFTKLNEAGETSPLPGTDPKGAGNASGNWEYEEAMDVEWAHALAPAASIVLVEANSSGLGDLYSGINIADHLPGVSVVSLSWGGPEFEGENYWDSNYQTPNGQQGVTFVAASGDAGAPGIYPAYSPNVVAVGGTALQLDAAGDILGETAWSDSGGGTSAYEAEPTYQEGVQSTGYRTIPDVAFDASGASGVSVYDSYDNTGGGPWVTMWGTSLGAPCWSALIAVADQGRVAAGGTTLDGPSQTLPALYSLPSSDFHDITSGSNGTYSAGPGYDEVTGLGSPVANLLVPDLAFYGMADHLVITAQPGSSVTAGQSFGLTVAVEMPDGTIDTGASGTLTLSMVGQPGGASLGGTLSATIDQGVAVFSGLSLDLAGSGYSLSVGGDGLGSVTSSTFAVTPAAASQLVIAAEPPSSTTAGGSFGLTVDVEDAFGNLVGGYSGDVTLALAGGDGSGNLGGTLNVAASGGVANFAGLSIDQAGTGYIIDASASGLTSTDADPVDVVPAAPSQLIIEVGPPSSLTAGEGFGLTVEVEDAFGNVEAGYDGTVTVGLAGGPSGAELDGATSATATSGEATFSGLELTTAGTGYALAVTATGVGSMTSSSFAVMAAAPSQLVIEEQPPSSTTAGTGFGLSVAVEDAYGNPVADEAGSVTLALAGGPAGGSLGGTLQGAFVGGVASFSGLAIDRAGGGYAIEASAAGLPTVSTGTIAITPAAPAQLVLVSGPGGSVAAGSGIGLIVDVEDAFGNLVTGYGGDVTAALTGGAGNLGGTLNVTASGGVASFSGLSIDQAGTGYTIEASASGLSPVSAGPFAITPAAPAQLVIEAGPPSMLTAGTGFGLSVSVEDAYGNLETDYAGDVAIGLAGGPAGAALGGTTTVAASGGVATFSGLTLTKAGPAYELEASSGTLTTSPSGSVDVTPAAPAQLVVTQAPAKAIAAGAPFDLGVSVEDAYGNVVPGAGNPVTLSLLGGPAGSSLGGMTTVAASGGVATFTSLTVDQVGTPFQIQASSPGLASATTADLSVTPASPAQLVITLQPPTSVTAGSGFGLGVSIEDAYGNLVTGYGGDLIVSLRGGPAGSSLSGTTSEPASLGTATFSGLTLDRAGSGDVLEVAADGLSGASTAPIRVVDAAPSRLVIVTEPPGRTVAGQPFGFSAALEDAYGNVETGFGGTVNATLAMGPAGGALSGRVSATAVNGVANFPALAIDQAGSGYAVEASSGGLSSDASTPITVVPGTPSRLIITLQPPGSVPVNRPFAIGVEAVDAFGNLATGFDGTLTAALAGDADRRDLDGTLSVQASGGEALIGDASLKKAGKSYTLTITSAGLTPAASSVFDVSKPSASGGASSLGKVSRPRVGRHRTIGGAAKLHRPR